MEGITITWKLDDSLLRILQLLLKLLVYLPILHKCQQHFYSILLYSIQFYVISNVYNICLYLK